MALRLIASSFTAPGADLRWDDDFLCAERARLGLGRRTDRMTAAVLSALDRLEGRPNDAPLLFGSMLGVQSRITALQNDLIDFPEDQIGPVSFSCSVHNAVPGAATIQFGMKVPVFSLAGFDRLPERVLSLAEAVADMPLKIGEVPDVDVVKGRMAAQDFFKIPHRESAVETVHEIGKGPLPGTERQGAGGTENNNSQEQG